MNEPAPTTQREENDPDDRLASLRPRATRRVLVAVSGLMMGIAAAILWFDAGTDLAWHTAYLATGALALTGLALLRLTVRAHLSGSDERLAAVRDVAYRISYWILAPTAGVALLAVELAWNQSWGGFTLEPTHLRALLLAFFAGAVWLPPALLAWRELEI